MHCLAWWWQLKYFSIFTPKIGEDEPIWTEFFQLAWFNHQPVGDFRVFLGDLLRIYGSHKLRQSPLNSLVIVRVLDPLALKTKDFHPRQVQKDWTCTKDCSWDSI